MDLRSDYPYWLLKNGLVRDYTSLHEDVSTDVLVVGAGITGALVAWHLTKAGIPTVVVDKRNVGMGSTAASTSLLQYEIDTPLTKLQKLVGTCNANRSYLLCKNAIDELAEVSGKMHRDVAFRRRPSFQFSSRDADMAQLHKEYALRKEIGFELELLSATDVQTKFHLAKPAGILSKDGGQVDAYLLTHCLLEQVQRAGNFVFDHSPVTAIKHRKHGIEAEVLESFHVTCKKLVIACGYESQEHLPKKVERLASTYAIVSERFDKQEFWWENALVWETAMPYLYMKVTSDYRIIVGGKDVPFYNPSKRDALIQSKAKQLRQSFLKLFAGIPLKIDFQWAGTFSNTKDGLPFIGCIPERPHTFFALGFGGNGITFSQIAGQLIRDSLLGKNNPDINLFSFNR